MHMQKLILFIVIMFALPPAYCKIIVMSNAPNDYWSCKAIDLENISWGGDGQYERSALTTALSNCKKNSRVPQTCKVSSENCDGIIRAYITKDIWQCTSMDVLANYWRSTVAAGQDEAALSAKSLCTHHSSVPETCYINLLTCKHLD